MQLLGGGRAEGEVVLVVLGERVDGGGVEPFGEVLGGVFGGETVFDCPAAFDFGDEEEADDLTTRSLTG